jgi:2-iminobutanoate/2-iminopropanoate deaminase
MSRNLVHFVAAVCLSAAIAASAQEAKPVSQLPFSAARKAGNTLYVSGQIPRTPDGADVKTSVAAETRQVMENIGRVLEANGYTFDDVVFANVYLENIEDYHEMNAVYASFYDEQFPARACVGGQEIVFGFRVEISCIAHKAKPPCCPTGTEAKHDEDND